LKETAVVEAYPTLRIGRGDAGVLTVAIDAPPMNLVGPELWGRAGVGYRLGIHHMCHPRVGDLHLYRYRLNAPYPGGDHVLMYRAESESDSARALEERRSLASTQPTPAVG
jgi:hypothetical protein